MHDSPPTDPSADALASDDSSDTTEISWSEALRTWTRIALLSFGGPTGQIAVMHRILVDEKRWFSEERFLHALNFCMLLPGPEAQQLATYLGWLLHRTWGGIVAGTLFILPGVLAILGLSILYVECQEVFVVHGVLLGLKAAVLAIVAEAVQRIGKRVLKRRPLIAIAVVAFLGIFLLGIPFPVLIVLAGIVGFVGGRIWPEVFASAGHGKPQSGSKPNSASGESATAKERRPVVDRVAQWELPQPTWGRALRVSALCLTLWWAPVLFVAWWQGGDSVYVAQSLFFSKAAMVTFGGAYSVLSYVAQQAVERFHWLTPPEMLDGLGLAETTPGPLIMVVQYVAFLGAYRNPGTLPPLSAAILGSLLTTWVTFVPCFYWIFLGAPYIERLRSNRAWNSTLTAITAAVVGVVFNLAVWFAIHTLFAKVDTLSWGPVRLLWPEFGTYEAATIVIGLLAFALTFVWKRGMAQTLAACATAGVLWQAIWG